MTDIGIVGYGVYVPRERIQSELVLREREKELEKKDNEKFQYLINRLKYGLLIKNKSLAGMCEDPATMAYEAAANAMRMSGLEPDDIGAVIVGTESKPYEVGTIATQVAEWLGIGPRKYAFDIECACAAGQQALSIVGAYVAAGKIDYGLAIGADVATSEPRDDLEYASGSAAVGGIMGKESKEHGLLARLYERESPYTSDYKDFYRRSGVPVPSHFGETTADAYIKHTIGGLIELLEMCPDIKLREFTNIVWHTPNNYMVLKTSKIFVEEEVEKIRSKPEEKKGLADYAVLEMAEELKSRGLFERVKLTGEEVDEKIKHSLIFERIGNPYAASTGLGLANVLDKANPGDKILSISYGSGAHALVIPFEAMPRLLEVRNCVPSFEDYVNRMVDVPDIKTYLSLFKERTRRWAREHLVFRKMSGEIEPADDNPGFLETNICKECGTIYAPKRVRCLYADHRPEDLVDIRLPYKAVLKYFQKSSLRRAIRERSSDIMLDDKVILVDCGLGDLEEGMELEPVIRKLDHHGHEGYISYGWAYRPVFRNQEKYISQFAELTGELIEIPPLVH